MADEKKKIREFEEATTIYEDDYLAIDGNIGKTRKIKPIRIGATYEIEDGDHEFTLVGSNGYEHTVAIPYDNVSMSQAEYNALTEEEKMDGTARFIPDAISTDESELWGRVGRATLETEAQVISNAINELVDKTDETNSDVAELNSSLNNLIRQGSITNTSDNNGNVMVSLSGVNIKVILFAWDGLRIYIPFYYNGNWYCRVQTTAATPQAVTNTNLTFQFYYIRG